MRTFKTFAAASAFAKAQTASYGGIALVSCAGDEWCVKVEGKEVSPTKEFVKHTSTLEHKNTHSKDSYDFSVTEGQWRQLKINRYSTRFTVHHAVDSLEPKEIATIRKYGEFFFALRQGKIEPANEEQQHFFDGFKKISDVRPGAEIAWLHYCQEIEFHEALSYGTHNHAEYRVKIRAIARKGHKKAIELVKNFEPWCPNPPLDKCNKPSIKPINYSKFRGARLVPGSFGSKK